MDPKPVVFDISSDEEGWGETRGCGGGGGGDDYDWISELLDEVDREADDSDDVVLVGEVVLNPKQRLKSLAEDVDDDCVVLDGDPDKPVTIENDTAGESDDLLIVGEKGQIACRDYPHPRHLCAKFPFTSTPHERHCDLCHCYVCDSQAPCVHWGTGTSSIDHCHAADKEEFWKLQRKSFKQGDKAPLPVPKLPDTSPSVGPPQTNQILPLTLPNSLAPNQVSRPTAIRACSTPPTFGVPNIINQGRSQRSGYVVPRNKFQPHLVSQQLLNTRNNIIRKDRRHNVGNFGPQFRSSPSMLKRSGSVGVALTTNRSGYGLSNNNHGSQYSRGPTPMTTSDDKNPTRWQDFRSGMTSGSNAYQSSSQQNSSGIFANSMPSPPQVSSQPNVGNVFVNSVPQPQVSSQSNVGSIFVNSVPQPQVSSQLNTGSTFANSVPSQPQASSQPNMGSIFANSVPSHPQVSSQPKLSIIFATDNQPQVYSQPIAETTDNQDGFQQGNQTQSALDPRFFDFESEWVTPTSQSNQQPPAENFQLQSAGSTYDPSLVSEFDPQFPGCTNPGSLDFPFDSWILENQSVSGALEVSVPPGLNGLNVLSPEPAPIDSGIFFDF